MRRNTVGRLWGYGLGMLGPLLYFAWRYPLVAHSTQLRDLGTLSQYRPGEFTAYVGGMSVLFGLYVLAIVDSRHLPLRATRTPVFACGALMATVMLFMYPVTAIDVYLYAVRSRLFTAYGANPLTAVPMDFPADPWRMFAPDEWATEVSPYGPLWTLLAAPMTVLAGDRLVVALVGFKLLVLLCYLSSGWLIARTLEATTAAHPATGALIFLWNPLVLWEGVGNAHNDLVVMVLVLLALWAWATRRDLLVVPLLLMAALIKYLPLVLIPITAVALWRREPQAARRWRVAGWSLGLSLLVGGLALFPFYDLAAVQTSITNQARLVDRSPAAVAMQALSGRAHPRTILTWWQVVGGSAVIGALLGHLTVVWHRPTQLIRAAFELVYLVFLVAVWNFNAWYVIWPVSLVALLGWGFPAWRAIPMRPVWRVERPPEPGVQLRHTPVRVIASCRHIVNSSGVRRRARSDQAKRLAPFAAKRRSRSCDWRSHAQILQHQAPIQRC